MPPYEGRRQPAPEDVFMRVDRLRNLAVIDPDTACRIGIVTDYWVDATAGRVAALAIRPIDVDLSQRVEAARVACVGRDAVMLTTTRGAGAPAIGVMPERCLDRRHLTGLSVYTDVGSRLGRVDGAVINATTLEVATYELAIPVWRRWLPGLRRITADRVAWCGREVMVVRTDEPAKLRPTGYEDGFVYDATANAPVDAQTTPRDRASGAAA
jgi:sporulation protein YlmC with PRC-barrel domain